MSERAAAQGTGGLKRWKGTMLGLNATCADIGPQCAAGGHAYIPSAGAIRPLSMPKARSKARCQRQDQQYTLLTVDFDYVLWLMGRPGDT